jgi:hypothetical protein
MTNKFREVVEGLAHIASIDPNDDGIETAKFYTKNYFDETLSVEENIDNIRNFIENDQ